MKLRSFSRMCAMALCLAFGCGGEAGGNNGATPSDAGSDTSARSHVDSGEVGDSRNSVDSGWLDDSGTTPDAENLADGAASQPVYSLGPVPQATVPLPAPQLVPLQQTFFSLSGPTIPSKMVFAHYMLCCGFGGPNGGIASAEEEIIMAQTMGINGFALNAGAWLDAGNGRGYRDRAAEMFAAASALNSGFVLFFSADMTGLGYADVVAMMTAYANHPFYFKYEGRPVLSTYGGETYTDGTYTTARSWWTNRVLTPLAAQGINCFFVPGFGFVGASFDDTSSSFVSSYVHGQVANWGDLVQGLLTWQTLAVVNNQAGNVIAVPIIDAYEATLGAAGKIYMPLVITKYWGSRQPSNGNIYYEWGGGAGMEGQWVGAIAANVPWVEIGTWNDFAESYMMPMDDFALYNDWGIAKGWTKPSVGYAELLRYYIAWFRTGARPTIARDAIFWFYRTHPAAAIASSTGWPAGNAPGAVTRYVPSTDGSGHVPADADKMFVTVFAKSPASLVVGSTTEPVVVGVNQLALPFVAGPAPVFSLSRGGTTVVSGAGADAILASPPFNDWWNSTGFVER